MSYRLNEKVREMVPYEPISGNYRIRLDANESFLEISREMTADIIARISQLHLNRYPDPAASAVCAAAGGFFGVRPELITVGNGSDELLTLITQTLMSKGETLVCTSPDFSMYKCYGYLAENRCVEYQKDESFRIDVDALIDLIKKEDLPVDMDWYPDENVKKDLIENMPERKVDKNFQKVDFYESGVNDEGNFYVKKKIDLDKEEPDEDGFKHEHKNY